MALGYYERVRASKRVVPGGVQVIIGGEGRWNELRECSLVVSPYGISGEVTGALGVMGPMRMPYNRAISAVRYVAGLMSDLFRELYGGTEESTS